MNPKINTVGLVSIVGFAVAALIIYGFNGFVGFASGQKQFVAKLDWSNEVPPANTAATGVIPNLQE